MRTLILARVSHDDSGRQRSVDEQVTECLLWAEQEGWPVVKVIREVGSASRFARRERPEWIETLDWIRSGRVDMVLTWEHSRIARDLREYTKFSDLCLANNVQWGYGRQIHDFSRRESRLVTSFEAVLAEEESHRTSERVTRAVAANALSGRPHGKHVFGYRRIYDSTTRALLGVELDEVAAPVVMEAAKRVLGGDSLYAIAQDFNRRDIPTRRPKTKSWRQHEGWTGAAVKQMLSMPAYAALRQHRGEIIGQAMWPALITEPDWHALQAILNDASRKRTTPWRVSHLMTGVAWCGHSDCHAHLVAGRNSSRTRVDGRDHVSYYRNYHCPNHHTSVMMRYLDAIVVEHVLERLSRPDVLDGLRGSSDDTAAEQRELRQEIARYHDYLESVAAEAAANLDARLLFDQERRIKPRIESARKRLDALLGYDPRVASLASAIDVRGRWEELDVGTRRDILKSIVDVKVHPATRRGAKGLGQALERTEIVWRRGPNER